MTRDRTCTFSIFNQNHDLSLSKCFCNLNLTMCRTRCQSPALCMANIHHDRLPATSVWYKESHNVASEHVPRGNYVSSANTRQNHLVRYEHHFLETTSYMYHPHICMLTLCFASRQRSVVIIAHRYNNCQPICMCVFPRPSPSQSASVKSWRPSVFNDTRTACFRRQKRSN